MVTVPVDEHLTPAANNNTRSCTRSSTADGCAGKLAGLEATGKGTETAVRWEAYLREFLGRLGQKQGGRLPILLIGLVHALAEARELEPLLLRLASNRAVHLGPPGVRPLIHSLEQRDGRHVIAVMKEALDIVTEAVNHHGCSHEVQNLARVRHAASFDVVLLHPVKVVLAWTFAEKLLIPAAGALIAVNTRELKVAARLSLPLRMRIVKANIWRGSTNRCDARVVLFQPHPTARLPGIDLIDSAISDLALYAEWWK